jgi:NADH dehydrogenase I D subunit
VGADARTQPNLPDSLILNKLDMLINWAHQYSLWPMFFGLSCCFVEEAACFTPRFDIARFGAEVIRGSPRQSDLLITSGTIFKKVAPLVLRIYEQMPEPKWVISMGSCSNSGGMYDVYSVVQGVDQIIPVDIYIPGCPPRPEAVLEGLVLLQRKIAGEKPARPVLRIPGGFQGTSKPILEDGVSKARDPRGPGYAGVPVRGTSVVPPVFWDNRSDLMWAPPAARIELREKDLSLAEEMKRRFGSDVRQILQTSDMPAFHVEERGLKDVLRFLKTEANPRFLRMDDLTAIDESTRRSRAPFNAGTVAYEVPFDRPLAMDKPPGPDYTMVYHLLAFDPPTRIRLKVGLTGRDPVTQSITDIWPSADWYEREVFDLFGIRFEGHPNLRRLVLPDYWEGHPLRKSYPGRATEMSPYTGEDARRFQPLDARSILKLDEKADGDFILNLGPIHPGTHGLLRYVLSLRGETIEKIDLDIGFHHRGVEKIAERQSWHQFIPYTDRVDYTSGVANNLSYLRAVETLAGIRVPERAQAIRVMLTELFRLSNHLVWFGTFVQDIGAMSPVFYNFRDREKILDIVELITGGRLHPSWFRIGGVAQDLPDGWKGHIDEFTRMFSRRIAEYEALITKNPIFLARTVGVGRISLADAVDWGVTGPNLRACGLEWDLRKKFPYSGYENYDFEIPAAEGGDCYARYLVRVEEMRQSLRIVEQAAASMPGGRYLTPDTRYTLPEKHETLRDIESLIHHFITVTRGPKMPAGEAYVASEAPRGEQGYYVVSDGLSAAYRLHIRAPDYANVQAVPIMARGSMIPGLLAILGSVDYIMPDIDR